MPTWTGPHATPADTGIDTPLPYLNESWRLAIALLDKGRRRYWAHNRHGDGTVDHAIFFNRDEYVVSATAHLTAIIEGLFGVTPAAIGFQAINIQPNLPLYRVHRHTMHPSPWAERDNKLAIHLGTAQDVRDTVRRTIEAMSAGGGGYYCAPAHMFRPEVPWANIMAFVDTIQEYGHP
jgi:hypothetical protein